jgi:adenine-specific DNA-methyltransferase
MAKRKYDDLTKEELIRLLETRDRRDATRFGLVWEANEIERDKALNQDFVALDLDPELSCPKNADGWKNLIIEGDNFDALRYLRMTFAGRVKCIYIDPPYNTGNRDFVYNDRFVDKEDLWRHSKWCEFMFQRLTLAKDLLRQDGVIFVSIDDNEIYSLGLLMERIFREQNFVANVIWQKKYTRANDADYFSDNHDFVVCYAMDKANFKIGRVERTEIQNKAYRNPDGHLGGRWKPTPLHAKSGTDRSAYTFKNGVVWEPPKGTYRRYTDETMKRFDDGDEIWFGNKGDAIPQRKTFLGSLEEGVVPVTLWTHEVAGDNHIGRDEVKQYVPERDFNNPKPTSLLSLVLQVAAVGKSDIVLDFFAGSGTTAHAVHKLNKEDGGNRRVILVSSMEATVDEPDKNLCRDVCATRVRRVIEGHGDTSGLGGDFAYLRCRRIAPGKLTDIDHAQVWTALQLTHMPTLAPLDENKALAVADDGDQRLIYIPHFCAKDARALVKAVAQIPAAIVYTWQPDLVKARLRHANNVQVEAVPESLARRFGMRI